MIGPAHFYLFTLKALTFITLRRGRVDEALTMLAKLRELVPQLDWSETLVEGRH